MDQPVAGEEPLGAAFGAAVGGTLPPASALDVNATYRAHAAFLLRVALRLTGDRSAAEDIVQEAFLVLHRRRAEVTPGPALRGWLYRVVAHLVQRHRRGFARRFRLTDALRHVRELSRRSDDVIATHETAASVRELVQRLPFREREVFVLYELDELSGPEIAGLLGVAEGTVWSRLSSARQRFRRLAAEGATP